MPCNKTEKISVNESTDDKTLIQLVVEGHEAALNVLMTRYKHKLFAFISKYIKDEDEAYDILQETFIRVHLKANTYKPNYAFSTWLYQIAINLCRDWGRKQKLRRFLSLDAKTGDDNSRSLYDSIEDPVADVENLVDTRMQLQMLDQEIQRLPHKLKTALILFAIEGNSQEKCAALLGVTAKTIETRVYRARKILSQKLTR